MYGRGTERFLRGELTESVVCHCECESVNWNLHP